MWKILLRGASGNDRLNGQNGNDLLNGADGVGTGYEDRRARVGAPPVDGQAGGIGGVQPAAGTQQVPQFVGQPAWDVGTAHRPGA